MGLIYVNPEGLMQIQTRYWWRRTSDETFDRMAMNDEKLLLWSQVAAAW